MGPYPRTWFTLDEGITAIECLRPTGDARGCRGTTARGTSGSHALCSMSISQAWVTLPELMGKRLACDCSLEEVCEADILAGLVFEECVQQSAAQPARRKNRRVPRRGVLLAWGGLPGVDARAVPWRRWTQEAVVNCFLGLFPEPPHDRGPHQPIPIHRLCGVAAWVAARLGWSPALPRPRRGSASGRAQLRGSKRAR